MQTEKMMVFNIVEEVSLKYGHLYFKSPTQSYFWSTVTVSSLLGIKQEQLSETGNKQMLLGNLSSNVLATLVSVIHTRGFSVCSAECYCN